VTISGVVLASFYDDVMRELLAALGAALFFGNLVALMRRSQDADREAARTVARSRPGSPVRPVARPSRHVDLARAPLARTLAYLVLGFVIMVVGIAAMVAA
jgi:hypothetical protein